MLIELNLAPQHLIGLVVIMVLLHQWRLWREMLAVNRRQKVAQEKQAA